MKNRTRMQLHRRPPLRSRALLTLLGLVLLLVACDPKRDNAGLPDTGRDPQRQAAIEALVSDGDALVSAHFIPEVPAHLKHFADLDPARDAEQIISLANDPYWDEVITKVQTLSRSYGHVATVLSDYISVPPMDEVTVAANPICGGGIFAMVGCTIGKFFEWGPASTEARELKKCDSIGEDGTTDPETAFACASRNADAMEIVHDLATDMGEFLPDLGLAINPGTIGFQFVSRGSRSLAGWRWADLVFDVKGVAVDLCVDDPIQGVLLSTAVDGTAIVTVFEQAAGQKLPIPSGNTPVVAGLLVCGLVTSLDFTPSEDHTNLIELFSDGRATFSVLPKEVESIPDLSGEWSTVADTMYMCSADSSGKPELVGYPGSLTIDWEQHGIALVGTIVLEIRISDKSRLSRRWTVDGGIILTPTETLVASNMVRDDGRREFQRFRVEDDWAIYATLYQGGICSSLLGTEYRLVR